MKCKLFLWVAILLFLIVFPFVLNKIVLLPAFTQIAGDDTTWLSFWPIYLSAIASFAMVFASLYTLWKSLNEHKIDRALQEKMLLQNQEQLNEIKRQWDEKNRARLNLSIIINDGLILLKISNIGKNNAFDIRLKISQNFIDNILSEYIRSTFNHLQEKPFAIEAGKSKYFMISPTYSDSTFTIGGKENYPGADINKWLDQNKGLKIKITGVYCDLYQIDESFSIEDYLTESLIVHDALTNAVLNMKKGSIVQNDQYYPIQKSLHLILKELEKHNK
jgi:hypothetical protein